MPVLHATPAAFISHSNNRWNREQLQKNFLRVNPTLASGVCNGRYYPSQEVLQSMRDGKLSDSWTFLEQKEDVLAKDFYNGTEILDPDNGDHILVCLGGDFSRRRREWLPSRGVDSSYSQNRCGSGQVLYETTVNGTEIPVGINPNSNLCNHFEQDEIEHIPHITKNVQAAIDFLSKDDDGFFLLYEQGDVSLVL
jgi:alkaline phosphatase